MSNPAKSLAGWPQPYRLLDAQPYWEGLQLGQLRYQRCSACSRVVWPAHSLCTYCGVAALEWEASSGRGGVYSFSTIMRGPSAVWQGIVPYTVGFVELEEGYFLFTQFEGEKDSIAIGTPVQVRYIQRGDQVLPVFGPL